MTPYQIIERAIANDRRNIRDLSRFPPLKMEIVTMVIADCAARLFQAREIDKALGLEAEENLRNAKRWVKYQLDWGQKYYQIYKTYYVFKDGTKQKVPWTPYRQAVMIRKLKDPERGLCLEDLERDCPSAVDYEEIILHPKQFGQSYSSPLSGTYIKVVCYLYVQAGAEKLANELARRLLGEAIANAQLTYLREFGMGAAL